MQSAKIQARNSNAAALFESQQQNQVQQQQVQGQEDTQQGQVEDENTMEGLVEGTKTNYNQQWLPKQRGSHQSRDMLYIKELIEQLKNASNELVMELGRFPSTSPVVEASRQELEETCKRLTQSLGIANDSKPTQASGTTSGGNQNLQWLVEFWKIKYKEVAEKYNRLVLVVKQRIGQSQMSGGTSSVQWQQQQQQQQQQPNTKHAVQQQQSQYGQSLQRSSSIISTNTQVNAPGPINASPYPAVNNQGNQHMQVPGPGSIGGYAQSHLGYQQSQASLSPRPGFSTANTASMGPTPPETPRSFNPPADLPPDSAILFVEGAPQGSAEQPPTKVNVIRCDRVRPVPVKRSSVKIQVEQQQEKPQPKTKDTSNVKVIMEEATKAASVVQYQAQHVQLKKREQQPETSNAGNVSSQNVIETTLPRTQQQNNQEATKDNDNSLDNLVAVIQSSSQSQLPQSSSDNRRRQNNTDHKKYTQTNSNNNNQDDKNKQQQQSGGRGKGSTSNSGGRGGRGGRYYQNNRRSGGRGSSGGRGGRGRGGSSNNNDGNKNGN
eukprot:TRINITY_DN7058_c0_g1_i7.p1 TRINITY_DN7058_c0_g1~~TRINITY_DN7058_c0_g1_i7.p1  ORF type:complete len:604 (+),score=71.23 TRINITY_DN7058_c0_g1_i7:168-1814(+)